MFWYRVDYWVSTHQPSKSNIRNLRWYVFKQQCVIMGCAHVRVHVCVCVHTSVPACACACACARILSKVCARISRCTCSCIHSGVCAYVCACVRACACAHGGSCMGVVSLVRSYCVCEACSIFKAAPSHRPPEFVPYVD